MSMAKVRQVLGAVSLLVFLAVMVYTFASTETQPNTVVTHSVIKALFGVALMLWLIFSTFIKLHMFTGTFTRLHLPALGAWVCLLVITTQTPSNAEYVSLPLDDFVFGFFVYGWPLADLADWLWLRHYTANAWICA